MTEESKVDCKRRIKKLTTEKLLQFHAEIIKRDGLHVDLSGRGIESIVNLDGLQNATHLDLSHNKLTNLSQLKAVPRVTMLKLTNNNLNGDGLVEIRHLKKLVVLNVSENQVTRIPFEVLRNVRTLKALVLNNNSISSLDWLPKLPELNSLILSNNRISQIPQRILDGLPSLTKISISHNQLEEIPNLSHLSEITELRLSHNRIRVIPTHLAQLENLKLLELSHNQIDDWSGLEAISSLKNLRQLNLIGNPICGKKLEAVAKSDKKDECENIDIDAGSNSDGKQQIKEAKRLDAKNKHYNFKMKRLFPNLVVRDAVRVLEKRVHGYVAPLKNEKDQDIKLSKQSMKAVTGKRKRAERPELVDKSSNKAVDSIVKIRNDENDEQTVSTSKPKDKKQNQASSSTPVKVECSNPSAIKGDTKTEKKAVKRKQKQDKEKYKQQPKEIASGVLGMKQFKKTHKVQDAEFNSVNLNQVNFAPNVGLGGTSAWD